MSNLFNKCHFGTPKLHFWHLFWHFPGVRNRRLQDPIWHLLMMVLDIFCGPSKIGISPPVLFFPFSTCFWHFPGDPPKSTFWHFFTFSTFFWHFPGDPPKSTFWHFFDIFRGIRENPCYTGVVRLRHWVFALSFCRNRGETVVEFRGNCPGNL